MQRQKCLFSQAQSQSCNIWCQLNNLLICPAIHYVVRDKIKFPFFPNLLIVLSNSQPRQSVLFYAI